MLVLQAEEAAHARDEIRHIFIGEDIVERQHRHRMDDLLEALGRLGADAEGWAVGADQVWEACFDGLVALAQRIIGGIGDDRGIVLIIVPVMLGDFPRQAFEFLFGFGGGKVGVFLESGHIPPFRRFATPSPAWGKGKKRASCSLSALLRCGLRFGEEAAGGGAGFFGDRGAGQHTRDFLLALGIRQRPRRVCGRLCGRCGNGARRGPRPGANG